MSSKKKILKEELTNKDLENIRLLIRYEVAQIMFDLYRKRKVSPFSNDLSTANAVRLLRQV